MKRILVITTNLEQASFRLRIDALRRPLAERDFDIDIQVRPQNWFARRALLASANRYWAVILQRKLIDPTDARILRRAARRILYDIDDAVMIHAHEVGRFSRWRTNRRFDATLRIIDHVVAGNDYLAEMFRQRGLSVTVLPTTVDPDQYQPKEHQSANGIRLVWIGSNSTLPYLEEQMGAIREAARQLPQLRLVTIADRTLLNPGLPMEHVRWGLDTEAEGLARGDIGIAPTPRDPWTLGKCGFKIVQYMAAGLPVIASPVGANAKIVKSEETGLLADTPQQWVEAIRRLAGDVELRRRMGQAGRERIEQEYSLPRAAETWAQLLAL
jgi:glycosyltransferase involved in cell wall biosynthesis